MDQQQIFVTNLAVADCEVPTPLIVTPAIAHFDPPQILTNPP
jgi:hypothetical protein